MLKRLTIVALAVVGATSAPAAIISYSDSFGLNETVSGSFSADVAGNLISNLSNATLFFNGKQVMRPIFIGSYAAKGRLGAGGAQATFDNTGNNLLFIDSDYFHGDNSYDAFFISKPGRDTAVDPANPGTSYMKYFNDVTFTVTPTSAVPEPAAWALMIMGLGAAGAMKRRRNRQRVSVSYA